MIEGYCQNGKCKKPAAVRVNSGISVVLEVKDGVPVKVGQRTIDLCAEDADYFLHLRDDIKNRSRLENFVANCHKD